MYQQTQNMPLELAMGPLRSGVRRLSPGMGSLRREMGTHRFNTVPGLDLAIRLVMSPCGPLFAKGPTGCRP